MRKRNQASCRVYVAEKCGCEKFLPGKTGSKRCKLSKSIEAIGKNREDNKTWICSDECHEAQGCCSSCCLPSYLSRPSWLSSTSNWHFLTYLSCPAPLCLAVGNNTQSNDDLWQFINFLTIHNMNPLCKQPFPVMLHQTIHSVCNAGRGTRPNRNMKCHSCNDTFGFQSFFEN